MMEVGVNRAGRRLTLATAVAAVCVPLTVLAATLAQGYQSDSPLVSGTVVSLDPASTSKVIPAGPDSANTLVGVVVAPGAATLAVSNATSSVEVATGGVVPVFVSDLNGSISPGDRIAVSPIMGVGMKATDSGRIVGVAQGSFGPGTAGAVKQTVTDRSGKSHTAYIGSVPALVGVSYYTASSGQSSVVPQFLQNLANTIAGKTVPLARVVGAAVIILFAIITITVLLYSSVRNSIISIGRNPLSQMMVYRSLFQVVMVSLGIMLVALGSVYILVTR